MEIEKTNNLPYDDISAGSSVTNDYEGGLGDGTTRLIIWDLEFTAKGYIWPVVKTGQKGLIANK